MKIPIVAILENGHYSTKLVSSFIYYNVEFLDIISDNIDERFIEFKSYKPYPSIVFLDSRLLHLMPQIKNLEQPVKIVFFSESSKPKFIDLLKSYHPQGIVHKQTPIKDIAECFSKVDANETYFCS